jgi:hypothetical protein
MKHTTIAAYAGLLSAVTLLSACGTMDTLSYKQIGACNGSSRGTFSSVNQAYVLFALDTLTIPPGASAFNFDPTLLFTRDTLGHRRFYDPGVNMNPQELGTFMARQVTAPANPGKDPIQLNLAAYFFIVVGTSATDGASEANRTPYVLNYATPVGSKSVLLIKNNTLPTNPHSPGCDELTAYLHP